MEDIKVIKKPTLQELLGRIDKARLIASHNYNEQEQQEHSQQDMIRRFQDILDAYSAVIDDPGHRDEIERQMKAFLGNTHFESLLVNDHIMLMNSKEAYTQITQFADILDKKTFCYTPLKVLAPIVAAEFGQVSVMDPIQAVLDFTASYADLGTTLGALADIRYRDLLEVDVCIYDCSYSLRTWASDLIKCIVMAKRAVIFQTPMDLGVGPGIIDLLEALKQQGGLQQLLSWLDIRNTKVIDQLLGQRIGIKGGVLNDSGRVVPFIEAKYDESGRRTAMGVLDALVLQQSNLGTTLANIEKVHGSPLDYFVLANSGNGRKSIYTAFPLEDESAKNVLYINKKITSPDREAKFATVLEKRRVQDGIVTVIDSRSRGSIEVDVSRAVGLSDGVTVNTYKESLTPGKVAQLGLSPVQPLEGEGEGEDLMQLGEIPDRIIDQRQQQMNNQLGELVDQQAQQAREFRGLKGELATVARVMDKRDLAKLAPIRFKDWQRISTLKVDKRELYTYKVTI
jgi:hypothetical protein